MLTDKQHLVLMMLQDYYNKHQKSPTIAEIAEHLGIKSRGIAHRYVKHLAKEGYIALLPQRWRNIQLLTPHNHLPIIGKIAAGSPIEAIENQESFDLMHWFLGPGRYALKVEGDSMIDEGIMDGDIIVCQNALTARSGQIVVALIDQAQATLKRIDYPDNEHICLIPANQNHDRQVYHASRVTIQGIFVGLLRVAS